MFDILGWFRLTSHSLFLRLPNLWMPFLLPWQCLVYSTQMYHQAWLPNLGILHFFILQSWFSHTLNVTMRRYQFQLTSWLCVVYRHNYHRIGKICIGTQSNRQSRWHEVPKYKIVTFCYDPCACRTLQEFRIRNVAIYALEYASQLVDFYFRFKLGHLYMKKIYPLPPRKHEK